MSYKLVHEIINEWYDPTDKLVLIALASHADNEKQEAWPSVETLEKKTSMSRRTIQRSLRKLEQLGYIKDVTRYYESEGPVVLPSQTGLFS